MAREKSLITTDRQKKPLHCNLTGRECRGDSRGLVGLPHVATEVPEGYFNGWGELPNSFYEASVILIPDKTK